MHKCIGGEGHCSFFTLLANRVKARLFQARAVSPPHTEKFNSERPWLTCPTVNHETGAMYVYHRQLVLLLWQSLHERAKVDATSGGTAVVAATVFDSS